MKLLLTLSLLANITAGGILYNLHLEMNQHEESLAQVTNQLQGWGAKATDASNTRITFTIWHVDGSTYNTGHLFWDEVTFYQNNHETQVTINDNDRDGTVSRGDTYTYRGIYNQEITTFTATNEHYTLWTSAGRVQ